jgi:hypothetical protein
MKPPKVDGQSKMPLRKTLIERGKFLAETLSTNGIPNMFRSEYTAIKIMWMVLTTASFSYCCYGLLRSTFEYFEYNTVTQMNFQRRPFVTFPTITICPRSKFKTNDPNFTQKGLFNSLKVGILNEAFETDSIINLLSAQIVANRSYVTGSKKACYATA